ncbi:MAG TPA: Gfo/Idh/MocA family oxidoreductase [Bryobacteraceae bacterium]
MSQTFSRRTFVNSSIAATTLFSRSVRGANDRVRVGVIGVGNRSGLLIDQLPDGAEIVAVADCYRKRSEDAMAKRKATWRIYTDHRQLLDQKDIDGVIVGTNDHARVLCSIHAVQAGKDVYAEKPLSLYVAEGRTLVRAVRKYNRILQVGSQQRSMAMNRVACDFVRTGGLGRIRTVIGANYPPSVRTGPMPDMPVPDGMNWDMWLGQAEKRPYNQELFSHWMRYWDYSGGETTNWGAHGIDQIQSALGMSLTGPVEFHPLPDAPEFGVGWRYANGVEVRLELPNAGAIQGGAIFVGEKGRIEITRNDFRTDPPNMIKELPPQEEIDKWKRAQWQAKYHMENWLDCMRSRKTPLADVEIGHRSISVCHIANITRQLNRKLQWNPESETFVGDAEANDNLNRPRRKGYELPDIA